MHELSIVMNVIDLATEEAQRHRSRVLAVHLRVGPLSGVVPEALASAFELAREGTALADCRLVVEDVPITVYCPACEAERPAESMQSLRCRDCGTPAARVTGGQELELTALELEA
jgi:hydrogenase nickel incorporation protein HypA/HybF